MKQHRCPSNEAYPIPFVQHDGKGSWYISLEAGPLWIDFCPFCGVRLGSQINVGSEATAKENMQTVTFWLTNILRELPNDKIVALIQQLAERLPKEDREAIAGI
jgi:hypothetical protein